MGDQADTHTLFIFLDFICRQSHFFCGLRDDGIVIKRNAQTLCDFFTNLMSAAAELPLYRNNKRIGGTGQNWGFRHIRRNLQKLVQKMNVAVVEAGEKSHQESSYYGAFAHAV